ncbi:hypothetical protein [Nocardioides mangrovi]|uniref:Uncharacterized protein n=1 Tax=Nocardioides mangrovi TaxID=2874580 RepID=A0ABS7UCC4_9ACTN|nr:hypothetical protein [Nocardioides mangrovi]MBZ5738525.1 hypothetical protein [Nocardioides mangrovi]
MHLSDYDDTPLATPFELWCERVHLSPEDPDAWPLFELAQSLRGAA